MQIKCEAELEESVAPFGLHWNGFGAVSKGFRDGSSMLRCCRGAFPARVMMLAGGSPSGSPSAAATRPPLFE